MLSHGGTEGTEGTEEDNFLMTRIKIRHSAFGIRHSAFGIRHSAFGIRHSATTPDVDFEK
jgi:hypothetical protein